MYTSYAGRLVNVTQSDLLEMCKIVYFVANISKSN